MVDLETGREELGMRDFGRVEVVGLRGFGRKRLFTGLDRLDGLELTSPTKARDGKGDDITSFAGVTYNHLLANCGIINLNLLTFEAACNRALLAILL
jgi:hypothetical protein